MKIRLSKDEFVPFAPDHGTVRVNHNSGDCSGESKSLKITRQDDGSITAKCFRCGITGWYSGSNRNFVPVVRRTKDDAAITGTTTGICLPADATSASTDFPVAVRGWLAKGGITPVIAEEHGILWSDDLEQLYIPVTQDTSIFGPVALGYVLRRFEPKRYLTLTLDKARFWGFLRWAGVPLKKEPLIIVEDMISGLRCKEISDTMVLCGTEFKAGAVSLIVHEGYKEAVVFLDADNPQVRMKARQLAKRLSWMNVRIIETGKDPKHYSKEQLENLIHGNVK